MQYNSTLERVAILTVGTSDNYHKFKVNDLYSFLQKQFRPQPRTYLACVKSQNIVVYNTDTKEIISTFTLGGDMKPDALVFRNESELVIASRTNIIVWSLLLRKILHEIDTPRMSVFGIVASGQNILLYGTSIILWNPTTNFFKQERPPEGVISHISELYVLDSTQFLSCHRSNFVVWDTNTLTMLRTIKTIGNVYSLDRWNEKSAITVNTEDIYIMNLETEETQLVHKLAQEANFIRRIGKDKLLIINNNDGRSDCMLFNMRTKVVEVSCLFVDAETAFRPLSVKGSLVFYFENDNIMIYDADQIAPVGEIEGPFNTSIDLTIW